jgi:putative sterol carrier protein
VRGPLRDHAVAALRAAVQRADDRRLEQTLGSDRGLALLFAAMRDAYVPEAADGWTGRVQYDLRRADGSTAVWTVAVGRFRADARRGAEPGPHLVVETGAAAFVRMAAGQLDVGSALLAGTLDLRGDLAVAMRLGELFGLVEPAPAGR